MKKRFLPVALVLTGFFFSLHRLCASPTITATLLTSGPKSGAYSFTVDNLPTLNDGDAYYKVLLCTGDGHFFLGNQSDLANFVHFYESGGPFTPWAEATPVYDDGEDPTVLYVPGSSFGPTPSGATALRSFTGSLEVLSARKVVPDCRVTYVATVWNTSRCDWTGVVRLTYDATRLTPVSGGNTGQMTATVTGLTPGKQFSVFFQLETDLDASGSLNPATEVVLLGESEDCVLAASVTLPSEAVEQSHDPNRKYPSLKVIGQTDTEIEYLITFQNDGKWPATRIAIRDELDIDLQDLIVPGSSHGCPTAMSPIVALTPVSLGDRTYEWVFPPLSLNGTQQTGYGSAFFEPHTTGWLRFKVNLKNITPCGAILNRASIYFDCNPPVETDLAVAPIRCISMPPPTACDSVGNMTWQLLPANQGVVPGSPIANLLDPATLGQYAGFTAKWYPSFRLGNASAFQTGVSMARTEVYALVAAGATSTTCTRKIVLVPVRTTAGAQSQAFLVEDVPGDCQADLIITGGTAPYTFLWQWDGVLPQPGTSNLNLVGKSNVSVTVTDANGCTAVFSPVAGTCPAGPWWCSWWVWAAAGAAALVAVAFRFRKKQ